MTLKSTILEQLEERKHALTSKDLTQLFSVSKATISREAASGRLQCFRIGSSLRFDPKSVIQWAVER